MAKFPWTAENIAESAAICAEAKRQAEEARGEGGSRFAILVIWNDGEQEYLKEGSRVATFSARSRAEEQKAFMLEGMEDEVQSINVVPAPARGARS